MHGLSCEITKITKASPGISKVSRNKEPLSHIKEGEHYVALEIKKQNEKQEKAYLMG